MVYDAKDLSIKARVVVPIGFNEWSRREKIDYILKALPNPMVILSVNEITERRTFGSLQKKGGEK